VLFRSHARFERTCAIELPSVGFAPTLRFYEAALDTLERSGVDFTTHWGQWNAPTPERVQRMWGAAADQWLAARRRFLSRRARATFSTSFLERAGLAV